MKKAQLATISIAMAGILLSCTLIVVRYSTGHHWIPRQWEVHHREAGRVFEEARQANERFEPVFR